MGENDKTGHQNKFRWMKLREKVNCEVVVVS